MVAAVGAEIATAFVEIGLIALVLAILARLASRLGITAVPFFLIAGLGLGEGGVADIGVSEDFVAVGAEIGVLLLLLTLGLEYSSEELRTGLKTGGVPGTVDAIFNFVPGLVVGVVLGWAFPAAVLLGGVTWISSSGVISKVLSDLDRLGYGETPSILNVLVIEDLAMAVYLPVVAALVAGSSALQTATTVGVALVTVGIVLWLAMSYGHVMSAQLDRGNNEALLLAVFGLTLLVGGLAQKLQISAAIGAFLVGLALSGPVQKRARALIEPLRDLFAAIFFLFFAFQINPEELPGALLPALILLVITGLGKLGSGWVAAGRLGSGVNGRIRAGATLIARGEFSIVIASLGIGLADGAQLGSVAAAYVLLSAVVGPLLAKHADRVADALPRKRVPARPG
ncbi:MAG: cation:proton antiporter [Acidimicrobiia bacterium]|nr:cation:proton antiporter [Acidimicrobiia bacterium]MBT8216604.1 cation:proton antiporter [Acidimicrobiia bacterium]NNF11527.1 cation:proton antiporter [Acidimicrobiia bacterium]NNL69657.1 cation:proton antiporter [Acidimicrobiia bacterium]